MSPLILKVPKKANFGKSTAASSSVFLRYDNKGKSVSLF